MSLSELAQSQTNKPVTVPSLICILLALTTFHYVNAEENLIVKDEEPSVWKPADVSCGDYDCLGYELIDTKTTDGVTHEIRNYPTFPVYFVSLPFLALDVTNEEGLEMTVDYKSGANTLNQVIPDMKPWFLFYANAHSVDINIAQYMPLELVTGESASKALPMPLEEDGGEIKAMWAPAGTKFVKKIETASSLQDGIQIKSEISAFLQILKLDGYTQFAEHKIAIYENEPDNFQAEIWIVSKEQLQGKE